MILAANTIVTGDGATVLHGHALLVQHGRITQLAPLNALRLQCPAEPVTDCGDATLLPGLIDMHVHLGYWLMRDDVQGYDDKLAMALALHNAQSALAGGVTTLRDVFSPDGLCRQLNLAAQKGLALTPRVLFCNKALCITGGMDHQSGGATIEADGDERAADHGWGLPRA